jgi:uncharacterized membrane protein
LDFKEGMDVIGEAVEVAGVAVIIIGAIYATLVFFAHALRESEEASYSEYRRRLGRAIILGLEFLVAGDIIRTVAVAPTFEELGILAGIVGIRTFLAFSLEVEISGHWPWQGQAEVSHHTSDAGG